MFKPLIVLLSLMGILAFGFAYSLQADEPKPAATQSHDTGAMVAEEAEPAMGEEKAEEKAEEAETMNIAERALRFERLKTLVTALRAAGLVEALQAQGPFTVYAPNDEAFAKLPEGALEKLLADRDTLRIVLQYHIVPMKITAETAGQFATAKTLQGGELRIDATDGVKVNDARVVESDIFGVNGVIHVIDAVLLPEGINYPWTEPEEEEVEVEAEESPEY